MGTLNSLVDQRGPGMNFQDINDICELVASESGQLLPVGAGTKPGLSSHTGVTHIDVRPYKGIVSYDASEFLISARAGTPIAELQQVLAEQGQFLPFDPLFVSQGATLGGTLASGISGPERLLYGGLRDFVMEIEFIDGLGHRARGGGKVVKNAAGFDLPKLMCGSYGRLGIITEVTLKVFPKPPAYATLDCQLGGAQHLLEAMQRLQALPLPIAALDADPGGKLWARFAAHSEALPAVMQRATATLKEPCNVHQAGASEQNLWRDRRKRIESGSSEQTLLLRLATTPGQLTMVHDCLDGIENITWHYSCGGGVTWVHVSDYETIDRLDAVLAAVEIAAIVVVGNVNALRTIGARGWVEPAMRIKRALDPRGRYSDF